ncbi:MAG: homoserine dehydrogenase [Victivallales bacterium]
MREVKIGIIGFGTVGAGVVSCLLENGDVISRRTGVKLVLSRIADLDVKTDRKVNVPRDVLTTDAIKLIDEVDVVVELVGGTTKAKEFILAALKKGKPVVTANKALLAEHGEEIFAAAEKSKADIYYEASVCGGIPIIKALKEGLVANKIQKIVGIMNGTCNYILTKMEKERIGFEEVLKEAQKLGYAESNPSFDIDGIDTAHKTAILASLAYGEWFGMKPVHVQGIRGVSLCDIGFAAELGYRLKLLGIIKQEDADVEIRVHPTLIPAGSLLANISDVFNGVMVKGSPVGETLFYGRGAGRNATASAVVADLVDVALNLKFGSHRRIPAFTIGRQFRHILPMNEIMSRYYMRIQVVDKPGVVAKISAVIGNKGISISSLRQLEGQSADNVSLLIMTHLAKEQSLNDAVSEMEKLDCVRNNITLIHVEDI